jgi:Transposase DDE domain
LHVLIDSTGLQVYGAGQWLEARHGAKSRRKWCKLHLAVDAASGMIVAQMSTDQDADDPSQVGPLPESPPMSPLTERTEPVMVTPPLAALARQRAIAVFRGVLQGHAHHVWTGATKHAGRHLRRASIGSAVHVGNVG